MIDRKKIFCIAATLVMISETTVMADEAKTCKCPVTGEKVVVGEAEASSEYRNATVYLCCDECKGKFEADPKKFATKANMQLVSTGQAMQVKCPISGHPLDAAQSIVVDKVKVSFCCEDCKGEAVAAEGDKQLALLFGDEAFTKAFTVIVDTE
jgi:YHS domain-containing protein